MVFVFMHLPIMQSIPKTGQKLRYHCVSSALKPWHLHYLEQGYADVDRTLETVQTANFPAFWDVHEQLLQAKK